MSARQDSSRAWRRAAGTGMADLGHDPELNLFIAAESGRLRNPDLWEGVTDFHLLQALENYKRRVGGFRPALVAIRGNRAAPEAEET